VKFVTEPVSTKSLGTPVSGWNVSRYIADKSKTWNENIVRERLML